MQRSLFTDRLVTWDHLQPKLFSSVEPFANRTDCANAPTGHKEINIANSAEPLHYKSPREIEEIYFRVKSYSSKY